MGFWRREINHAYRLNSKERDELEQVEHEAYIRESKKLAERRGTDRARQDYE